eukprot:246572-Pleurochrysis_carterae.AAC.1
MAVRRAYTGARWRGRQLRVEVAKPSGVERYRLEREERDRSRAQLDEIPSFEDSAELDLREFKIRRSRYTPLVRAQPRVTNKYRRYSASAKLGLEGAPVKRAALGKADAQMARAEEHKREE